MARNERSRIEGRGDPRSSILDLRSSLDWRREAVDAAAAFVDAAWLAPIVVLVGRHMGPESLPVLVLLLGLTLYLLMAAVRGLDRRQVNSPTYELTLVGIVVVSALLGIRLLLYPTAAFFDFTWLGRTVNALINLANGLAPEAVVLLAVFFLWWRAVSLSQREFTFNIVAYHFRVTCLVLLIVEITYRLSTGQSATFSVLVFFLASFTSLALGRVEDKARATGGPAQAFGPGRVLIVLGSAVLTTVAGLVFAVIYSLEGGTGLIRLISPLWPALRSVLLLVGILIGWVLDPLMNWLQGIVLTLYQRFSDMAAALQRIQPQQQNTTPENTALLLPAWTGDVLRYSVSLIILGLVVGFLLLWLQRNRRERIRTAQLDSENLPVSGFDLGDPLGGLRGWRRLLRRFGLGARLLDAISVRNLYANLTRVAASRGFPRAPIQTPLEYLPTFSQAFPGNDDDLRLLTDAYIAVHYGELPQDEAAMTSLRNAYERLRQLPAPQRTQKS